MHVLSSCHVQNRGMPCASCMQPWPGCTCTHDFCLQLPDDCDSHMARAIQASLEDARAQQQRQWQQVTAAAAAATGGAAQPVLGGAPAAGEAVQDSTAVDPDRPSDADIIAWENQIK